MCRIDDGFAERAAAGERIWGVCEGFVDRFGVPIDVASNRSNHDGTFTEGGFSVETFASAADNQTDKKVRAVLEVSPFSAYSNTPDATIGTTTGSNLKGYTSEIIDEDEADESSAHQTTLQQLIILGLDPENSANGLYMILERQFMGG